MSGTLNYDPYEAAGWSPATAERAFLKREPAEVTSIREACAHLADIVNRFRCAYHNGPSIHGPSVELTAWLLDNAPPPFRYEHESKQIVSFSAEFVGVCVSVYIGEDDAAWTLVRGDS